MIAEQLKSSFATTVIVENKPGAGTTLGAAQVAKAEPDGNTLLMATSTRLAINKSQKRSRSLGRCREAVRSRAGMSG
jgi:tripartite-type tricarboxylate transporter receptor subunit TctC